MEFKEGVNRAFAIVRRRLVTLGAFSCFVNVLMLTGPIYTLHIYDRVLSSGSTSTLFALSAIAAVMFLGVGLIDYCRAVLLGRLAFEVENEVSGVIFDRCLDATTLSGKVINNPLKDLAGLSQFLTSPAPIAFLDTPWSAVYLSIAFVIHWMIGSVALMGMIGLFVLAAVNEVASRRHLMKASDAIKQSDRLYGAVARNVDATNVLGMRKVFRTRWKTLREVGALEGVEAVNRMSGYAAATKTLRLMIQSAVLGVGAWLAIRDVLTPGVMIAASIIVGRALAPIEQIVAHWRAFSSATNAYRRIRHFQAAFPQLDCDRMRLPAINGNLSVEKIFAAAPGSDRPFLQGISFVLDKGETMGIVGPSASGKSTLARVLVGAWRSFAGSVRLDGADISLSDREDLGSRIGYLPQDIELFEGRIRDNIARFVPDADHAAIIEAAQSAGVHQMILSFPNGYETEIGEFGAILSAGQRQRIALARAVYGNPALVVLDEPNSNLDEAGNEALSSVIREMKGRGQTVIIVAHRWSAIANVDKLLVLEEGRQIAFGPREEVVERVFKKSARRGTSFTLSTAV